MKFLRFAQWKINESGKHGIVAMITNNGFLDNPTFRGMRYQLMQTYDEIYCLNLHGSTTKKESHPDGSKDENVFNIQTGTGITFFIKTTSKKDCKIFYKDVHGLQKTKYEYLNSCVFSQMEWQKLKPVTPYFFFVNKDLSLSKEYEKGWKINNVFTANVTGIVTARDALVIDIEKDTLLSRIKNFCDTSKTDGEIRNELFGKKKTGKYLAGDSRGWKLAEARKNIYNENYIKNISYRPFDTRSIYYHSGMVDWGRQKIMRHFLQRENLGVCLPRQCKGKNGFEHGMVSMNIVDGSFGDAYSGSGTYFFPLYLYPENELTTKRESNFKDEFIKDITEKLGEEPTPENIFYYAYAVFHCPSYRQRYSEFLKIDFPRLPLTNNKELFYKLSKHGKTLVNLHLLGENPFDESDELFKDANQWQIKITSKNENYKIEKIEYNAAKNRVYFNKDGYFEGIDKATWQFMIGGYQPLDKWLKDRKKAGIELSTQDTKHYMKIAVSLRETQKIMQAINKLIPNWDKF